MTFTVAKRIRERSLLLGDLGCNLLSATNASKH